MCVCVIILEGFVNTSLTLLDTVRHKLLIVICNMDNNLTHTHTQGVHMIANLC